MKNVPGIGTVKGLFDIFVPGVFLVLHVAAFLALCVGGDPFVVSLSKVFASNVLLATAALVCFGYLAGVLLRLLKTEMPDKLSGMACAALWRRKYPDWPEGPAFAKEPFPFFGYLKYVATDYLPPGALKFFTECWEPRKITQWGNRQFFNYCKLIVNAEDERSGSEAYAAEAMTRYVASMFYALLGAIPLTLLMGVLLRSATLYVVAITYAVAVCVILMNLKTLRFKEAETLFTTAFHNYRKGTLPL